MTIYAKSTKELMHDFAKEMLFSGVPFSKNNAVSWFSGHYPKIKPNTVAMHVDGMSVNSSLRKHHPSIKPGLGFDLFYKLGPNQYRLWDPNTDPAPIYKADLESGHRTSSPSADLDNGDDQVEGETAETEAEKTFAFERDLQNYLAKNLQVIEPGLSIYKDEDGAFDGIEYPAGQRYIDILAVGRDGGYVVIETKVSRAYDRVVGQILRYMGWISQNVAAGRPVRGVIVASEITQDLVLACSSLPNIRLFEYKISFSLAPVDTRPLTQVSY